jgi:hypothetical protein
MNELSRVSPLFQQVMGTDRVAKPSPGSRSEQLWKYGNLLLGRLTVARLHGNCSLTCTLALCET